MPRMLVFAGLLLTAITILAGCATVPKNAGARASLHGDVADTIFELTAMDPTLQHDFDHAYAYAVFPSVGEGAFGVGGAFGNGEVFEHGKFVGYGSVTQATIGPQIGGQSHSEVIFFQSRQAFDAFKADQSTFDAKASVVAEDGGQTAANRYDKGVMVVVSSEFGLMAQAAIGGQKFHFVPATEMPATQADLE